MALIGIDLGTTNSLVAVWKDDKVGLLKNSLGNVLTPSVVSLNDDGRNILVGEVARQRRVSHPGLTVAEFKRTMGTPKQYKLGNAQYSSEDLSAFLLKKLVADASEQLGEPVTEAVISVPAYFDDNQREATKLAAKIAGIQVKRLVNEPSAAVLYYQWKNNSEHPDGIYIVIDFGGGTLDISVVDCFENIIEIIAVAGDNQLGGKDFDREIALDFCERNNIDFNSLDNMAQQNIIWAAENVKKLLSHENSANMHVNIKGTSYDLVYTTEYLLEACAKVLGRIKNIINDALNGANISIQQIADVILVGGSCKMPVVQKYLSALFHRNITADDDIDNYVALGTGVLTGIINRDEHVRDIVMTDVCPFSLGIGTHSNENSPVYMSVIIPKNSILPISKSAFYSGLRPFQDAIGFEVYQGEEMMADSNLSLGKFALNVTPDEEGNTTIQVTFTYDINGILQVEARDLHSDNKIEGTILNKNSHLNSSDVEQKRMAMNNKMNQMVLEKDKEENRNIMAWAERLHAQADEEYKHKIIGTISSFATALESNNIAQIARAKKDVFKNLLLLECVINRNHFDEEDIIGQMLNDIHTEDNDE